MAAWFSQNVREATLETRPVHFSIDREFNGSFGLYSDVDENYMRHISEHKTAAAARRRAREVAIAWLLRQIEIVRGNWDKGGK